MGFFDIFFGSTQSQFTAYAIMAAIVAICITILLTRTDMTMGNKFLLVFFVILTLVPSVFLILFEITCMVTGGNKKERWWCWAYAWIIAAFIIIYCIFIIIISFTSLFTYNNAINKVELTDNQQKMSPQNSNEYAKAMIETTATMEKFEADMKQDEEDKKRGLMNDFPVINPQPTIISEGFNTTEVITTQPQAQPQAPVNQVNPYDHPSAAPAFIQPTANQDKHQPVIENKKRPLPTGGVNNIEAFDGNVGYAEL